MVIFLRRLTVLLLALAMAVGLTSLPRAVAAPPEADGALTNLEHLDFLLDEVSLGPVPGHTTYRLAAEPNLIMPWTYADARAGGTFERVGGGPFDPATGDWGQGAFNADDTTRAAVVYLRHWRQTGDRSSRHKRVRVAALGGLPPDDLGAERRQRRAVDAARR